MSGLVLGLPSKGRLMEATIAWFAARGIAIERPGAGREYRAEAQGFDDLSVVMISAGEVPGEISQGRIDLGVTGEDLIRERVTDWAARTEILARLGYGHADLVVAVPAFWVDVTTMDDLDRAAWAYRERHGRPMRVATKYHALTRAWFERHGVADYRLIDSQGATEAAPANRAAELIVDITSSGETLRANHLRPLADGPILRSEACLVLGEAGRTAAKADTLARLRGVLGVD